MYHSHFQTGSILEPKQSVRHVWWYLWFWSITETSHEHYGVWNNRRLHCLFNRLFRRTSKEISKLRVWTRYLWNSLKLVQVILVWQITVCPDQWHSIKTNIISMWCTSRICTWSNSIHYLHAAFGWHNQEAWNAVSHVCGWLWIIVRRAGLLWSQQDFEWRLSVPLFKCLTVLEFSFILFDLCLLITFFNFIMNYVPIVTFWIFTYHKIWILSIMFCFIWSYWIIYFLACLEVSWRVVS